MALLSIEDTIVVGDISTELALNYNSKQSLFNAMLAPITPIRIAMVTDALRWGNEAGQNANDLRGLANYLIWLCGRFHLEALSILGISGGSVIPTPSTGIQFPFYIYSPNFETDGVTYLNSKIDGFSLELFIDEYNQYFYASNGFNYVSGGGFTITLPGFDANNFQYTVRVGRYFPIPT